MLTTLHELEREVADDQSQNDYWARTRRNILQPWFEDLEPDSILAIGCGSGYLANSISRDDTVVSGVDIDRESIGLAAKRPNIDLTVVGDASNLPYTSGTFDCVLMSEVVEHFEDPHPILKESNRVLSEDGSIIISVPAFRWLWGPHDEHNSHADCYNTSRLTNTVNENGFVFRFSQIYKLFAPHQYIYASEACEKWSPTKYQERI